MSLIKLNATRGLEGALPAVSGASLTGVSAGKVLQVVQHHLTSNSTFSSNAFEATGLTLNITPASSSNKIYLQTTISLSASGVGYNQGLTFFRDSTQIGEASADSNRGGVQHMTRSLNTSGVPNSSLIFLDSPSTTSQITYTVKCFGETGTTHYINRLGDNADQVHKFRMASVLVAMEIES